MKFSPSKPGDVARRILWVILALGALGLLGGCIADTAEDSDLPWASNQGWEGMIPLPVSATQYD